MKNTKSSTNKFTITIPKPTSKQGFIAVLLFAMVASVVLSLSWAAGNASYSLSPGSGSYNKNSSFSVSIYENSGSEAVTTVDAKLIYDQSKLRLVGSPSTAGSPFNNCLSEPNGGGNISIVCSKLGGSVTGKQLVGRATFKVLAGSSNTAVTFSPESRIYKDAAGAPDIWNGNTAGGTYTLKTPVATQNPSPSNDPSPSSSSSSGGSSGNSGSTGSSSSTSSGNSSSPSPPETSNQENSLPEPEPNTEEETSPDDNYFVAPPSPSSTTPPDEGGPKAGLIAAAIVGVLIGFGGVVFLAYKKGYLNTFIDKHLHRFVKPPGNDGSAIGDKTSVANSNLPAESIEEKLAHIPSDTPKPSNIIKPTHPT